MAKEPESLIDRIAAQGDFILAFAVFGLLMIMLVPLPAFLLDLLLTLSIGLSLLLFQVTLNARKALDVSIFPIALLVTTVFRLALNVASTRRILLEGHNGPEAAGRVIQAFGQFVVGGNYVVGLVVFFILVVINFVVITKGAGRVAEVGARFTLDAMPGKQMAIDADLNAGLIDEIAAKKRRGEIAQEADFYGSMDGASKFIRGDAIAGIIITLINILGGAFIGVFQNNMTLADAAKTYTILTIGDGLAGQVPALIISTAAGLLVTRVQDPEEQQLHKQISGQFFNSPRVLLMVSFAMLGFAAIPGMRVPFILLALAFGWIARRINNMPDEAEADEESAFAPPAEAAPEDLLPVEPLCIEVGLELLYLVDDQKNGELISRIQRTRSQFAQELGVVLPSVHLRDNLNLGSGEYVIYIRGEEIGRGTAFAHRNLALDPGTATGRLKGIETIDPVFSLPAWWIPESMVLKAQALGYTVVDVQTVLTTHFVELMHSHAHELFDSTQLLKNLERMQLENPKLIDDLIPDPLHRNTVLKVFRNLIREGLSTRDTQTILEALADYAPKTRDPEILTEFVRQRMARHITRKFSDEEGVIHYAAFAPKAEDALLRSLQTSDGAPKLMLDPALARQLFGQIQHLTESFAGASQAVVLCPPLARGALRKMLERIMPRVIVLSSAELLPSVKLKRIGLVDL